MFCEDRINAFDAMNSDELPKLINIKDAINFVRESVSHAQAITFVDGIVTFLEQQPDGDFTVDNSFIRGLSKLKKEIVSKEFLKYRTHD